MTLDLRTPSLASKKYCHVNIHVILETWDLRPVWCGKSQLPSCLRLRSHGLTSSDLGPQDTCEAALNKVSRTHEWARWDEIRDVASHRWMPNDWRLWCTAKAARDMFLVFLISSLILLSLTHTLSFQLDAHATSKFARLKGSQALADIKSKIYATLCSNHGVTGHSGAAHGPEFRSWAHRLPPHCHHTSCPSPPWIGKKKSKGRWMGLEWLVFSNSPTCPVIWNTRLAQDA